MSDQAVSAAGRRPIALVTGGARRVGRAICESLARSGCDVHFTFLSSETDARDLESTLSGSGASTTAHRLDLSQPEDVARFLEAFRKEHDRLDALILNASVYQRTPLASLSYGSVTESLTVNAASPLMLVQGLAPLLERSLLESRGAIVALCDIHAMGHPRREFSAYSMSKAALTEMVRSLAVELAPAIRVNGVAPGVVAFPETGEDSDESFQERYLRRVPLRRPGVPADAAEAVRWLVLDAAYVTGQIVAVDGGRSLT